MARRKRRQREALDYFRFDVVAYLTSPDVAIMTAAQEGAFVRLLAFASKAKDCALDNDDAKLAKLSKLGDEWSTLGTLVRAQFVEIEGDPTRIVNEKLRTEWLSAWDSYRDRCKRNRKNRLSRGRVVNHSSDESSTTGALKETVTVTGKETVVPIDPTPNGVAAKPRASVRSAIALSWSTEAVKLWEQYMGPAKGFGGRIGSALKPVEAEYGWATVRPLWEQRLQDACTWDDPGRFTPEIFARSFKALATTRGTALVPAAPPAREQQKLAAREAMRAAGLKGDGTVPGREGA